MDIFSKESLLDLLFPRACVACGVENTLLCGTCTKDIPFGLSMAGTRIAAAAPYRHEAVRRALWALKYRRNRAVADTLAEPLAETLIRWLSAEDIAGPVALIPVPLSRRRKRMRGYNQAETLARSLAAHSPEHFVVLTRVLWRTRHTKPQTETSDRAERLANLHGSFTAHIGERHAHLPVVLIDDVTTTGATFTEARHAVRAAGARTILCFAAAH